MELGRECREAPEVLRQRFGPFACAAGQMNELVHEQEQPGRKLRNNRDLLLDDETCTFKSRAPLLTTERVDEMMVGLVATLYLARKRPERLRPRARPATATTA